MKEVEILGAPGCLPFGRAGRGWTSWACALKPLLRSAVARLAEATQACWLFVGSDAEGPTGSAHVEN